MNAYIYARQSSGDENTSESVELQIEKCKELALKENISVIGTAKDLNTSGKTYPSGKDAEALAKIDLSFQTWYKEQSGHKMFREGFGEVIENLSNIDYIIVYDITRLYRPINGSHLESYVNQLLIYHNVKVMTVSNGSLDVGTFNDSIITALQNRINHEHIATCRRKSIAAMNKLRDSGIYCNGGKAFGIKYVGNKQFEIEPRKAEVIKYIFEEIAKYKPYLQIIRHINDEYQDCFKKCCYESNLYHIAANPIYAGYMYNTAKELIPNIQMKGKEIISFDLWKKVQEIMAKKRKEPHKGKKNWLPFSSLLYDGFTNTKLVTRIDKGKIFYFPNIKNLKPSVEIAGPVYFNIAKKEYTGIYQAIIPILIIAYRKRLEKNEHRLQSKKEIEKYQVELENLRIKQKDITDNYMSGLIDRDIFEDALLKVKKSKSKLDALIADAIAESYEDIQKLLYDQWTEFHKLIECDVPEETYETLLKETVQKIVVYRDKVVVYTDYGKIPIPRYLVANKKHFPKWIVDVEPIKNPQYQLGDFRNTHFIITYKMPTAYNADTQVNVLATIENFTFQTIGVNE